LAELRWGRVLRWAAIVVGGALVAAVAGFVVWGSNPLGPNERALGALASDARVAVSERAGWYEFAPRLAAAESSALVGFVFYPGGHADVRSYAPLCRAISEAGYLVALPKMPLSLAVFDVNAADKVVAAHPEVPLWGIGGHSLGGAMAAQCFSDRPGRFVGLALVATYPPANVDLSQSPGAFVSVYGSMDGQAAELPRAKSQLPVGTPFVVIEGGNHGQIGDYGPQPGDGVATISAEAEQRQAADAIIAMLRRAAANEGP
jgi:pimeloyl-ACP methyl ester carboxylesterase